MKQRKVEHGPSGRRMLWLPRCAGGRLADCAGAVPWVVGKVVFKASRHGRRRRHQPYGPVRRGRLPAGRRRSLSAGLGGPARTIATGDSSRTSLGPTAAPIPSAAVFASAPECYVCLVSPRETSGRACRRKNRFQRSGTGARAGHFRVCKPDKADGMGADFCAQNGALAEWHWSWHPINRLSRPRNAGALIGSCDEY